MRVLPLLPLLTATVAVSPLQADDEAAASPALDPVNFARIMVVDEAGDSFDRAAPESEEAPTSRGAEAFAVRDLVLAGNFPDAMGAALRTQDPDLRRRLALGIVNHLCQSGDLGNASDLVSYHMGEAPDLKSLAFLMIAVRQSELGYDAAQLTLNKARGAAQGIPDENRRSEILGFIAATHLPRQM